MRLYISALIGAELKGHHTFTVEAIARVLDSDFAVAENIPKVKYQFTH